MSLYWTESFNPEEWLKDGLLLKRGQDYAMFTPKGGDTYEGHYLLRSRGKEAVIACKAFLAEFFKTHFTVFGLTPVQNKKALWMSRTLGFTSQGIVPTANGDCELFILTRNS